VLSIFDRNTICPFSGCEKKKKTSNLSSKKNKMEIKVPYFTKGTRIRTCTNNGAFPNTAALEVLENVTSKFEFIDVIRRLTSFSNYFKLTC